RTLAREAPCYPGGITFSPDGRRVVVVYHDKAHVHETASGKRLCSYSPGGAASTHVVEFSPDGRSVLSYLFPALGTRFARAQVWAGARGRAVSPELATGDMGPGPKFTPDSRGLLLHQGDGEPVVMKVRTGQVQTRLARSEEGQKWTVPSPDGLFVAVS